MHNGIKQIAGIISCTLLLLLGACSDGSDKKMGDAFLKQDYAVGRTYMTFIDTSRPTAAHASVPESPSRTLETAIVYPAEGQPGDAVTEDAAVDTWGAPFPLVVLSHGLGGNISYLLPLAEVWASRGYVVAVPRFPLTNTATAGGPIAQDVQNQPADVSFVIDQLLAASSASGQPLSNAIDGGKIAASGHSNGGITTFGLVANSCCRDERITAAIVFAGAVSPFAGGVYDLADTPPILIVQGVNDILINYNQTVRTYNEIQPIKGLLTLEASDHGSFLIPEDAAFDVVAKSTVDFLDGVLRGDDAAIMRLPQYQLAGIASLHWAPDAESNTPVETLPEPETNRQAFLSADSNLVDGQVITVTWSGFLPEKVVNIMQCSGDATSGAAACNISGGKILYPDPLGMGSLDLVMHTGPIGNGICDSANPCTVIVNDASLTDPEATLRIPVTFAN